MPLLRRSWLAVLLAALFAVAAPASTALAQDESIDNGAVAINEEDGSSEIDVAFDIRKVLDGIVDQTNAAVAYSSCEECQTIAIAIQLVLVNSPVEVLTPENLAVAINEGCFTCMTVALAYQIVIGEATKLRFTGEAQRRLAGLAKALRELERSDGSAQEVVDEVTRIMTDLSDVLSTGLRPAGPLRDEHEDRADEGGGDREDPGRGDPSAQSAPAAEATPTPSPSPPSTTATPTPTPTPTATVTPSPTATDEPTVTPEPTATATP